MTSMRRRDEGPSLAVVLTGRVFAPQVSASEKNNIGMVVIRGNSIVMIEALEKLWGDN